MSYTKRQAKIKVTELVSLIEHMLELHKKDRGRGWSVTRSFTNGR